MSPIDILSLIVGTVGVAFGANCYLHLWRWAKQCQNARIVCSHNRRVQINAPLVEWLSWANQLKADQKATGRIVYRNQKVTVAILRPDYPSPPRALFRHIRETLRSRRKRNTAPTEPTEPTPRKRVAAGA